MQREGQRLAVNSYTGIITARLDSHIVLTQCCYRTCHLMHGSCLQRFLKCGSKDSFSWLPLF